MESRNKYAKVDIYKSNSSKKPVVIAVIIILIFAIIIGVAVAMFTSNKPSENSPSNNTASTTTTASTSTTISGTVTPTTSTTTSGTVTPTVTTTTGTADPSITTTPYSFKSTGFDMKLSVPAGWVATEIADPNQKDCQTSADYLRKTCTGNVADSKLVTVKSSDGTSVVNIQGAMSGVTPPTCGGATTSFYTTVKNIRVDFVTCVSGGVFSAGRTLVNYAGTNSVWKSVFIDWTSKDRATVDVILDIIGSIY